MPSASTSSPKGTTALIDGLLSDIAARKGPDSNITLGELIDGLQERAFGMLLLLFALPCCLPFVYGLPQIVAFPMLFLAGQMALGRQTLWLPDGLRDRSFKVAGLQVSVDRARRYVGWFETLSHPRLTALTGHRGSRIVGALLLIPCASILIPLPLTNTVPGIGVAIASIGLIERDGLVVGFGLFVGLVWVAVLFIGGPAALLWLIGMVRGA